jgi:hypothetical protein
MSAVLFKRSTGKAQQIALIVLLVRVGLIIPSLTAAVESYLYIGYVSWLFTGVMSTAWSALHQAQPVASESSHTK